jgi:hypothetical protein
MTSAVAVMGERGAYCLVIAKVGREWTKTRDQLMKTVRGTSALPKGTERARHERNPCSYPGLPLLQIGAVRGLRGRLDDV